jgi:hypothetical protein
LVSEAIEIGGAIGTPAWPGAQQLMRLAMLVWRGNEEEARRVAEEVSRESVARGQGLAGSHAEFCLGQLELSFGRYEAARDYAIRVFDFDSPYTSSMALGDMLEATVRSGSRTVPGRRCRGFPSAHSPRRRPGRWACWRGAARCWPQTRTPRRSTRSRSGT